MLLLDDAKPGTEDLLSVRVRNALDAAGVESVVDLRAWSESRLRSLRHMGNTSIREVRRFLAAQEEVIASPPPWLMEAARQWESLRADPLGDDHEMGVLFLCWSLLAGLEQQPRDRVLDWVTARLAHDEEKARREANS